MLKIKLLQKVLQFGFFLIISFASQAYEVETNSTENIIFVLLNNPNENGALSSINVSSQNPSFISGSKSHFVPIQIPAGKSNIVALSFDVDSYASLNLSDNLTLNIQGIISGQLIQFNLDVPLTTVNTAAEAQGFTGFGVPSSSLNDIDNDGDGISDIIELAYGSDPNSTDSIPGAIADENIPTLHVFGIVF